MKQSWIVMALMVLAGCGFRGEPYHYASTANVAPAVLQYRFAEGAFTDENLFGDIQKYENEMYICDVDEVKHAPLCNVTETGDVKQFNRVLLSPGRHRVTFRANTKSLRGLSVAFDMNAISGETYYIRAIALNQDVSDTTTLMQYAGLASFSVPTVQIFDSRGQVLHAATFKPYHRKVSGPPTANGYSLSRNVTEYLPVYITAPPAYRTH